MDIVKLVLDQLKTNGTVLIFLLILYFIVDRRWLRPMQRSLQAMGRAIESLFSGFEVTGTILARRNLIQPQDLIDFFQMFSATHRKEISDAIGSLSNPLSLDEHRRLQQYADMIYNGQPFTIEQAQEFHRLSKKLREEKPEAPGSWILALLAGFLLGVVLGSQKK